MDSKGEVINFRSRIPSIRNSTDRMISDLEVTT